MHEYLGLEGGPPQNPKIQFRQDFTCPALLKSHIDPFPYGAVTHSGPPFQTVLVKSMQALAWSPFARHYSGSLAPDRLRSEDTVDVLSSGY